MLISNTFTSPDGQLAGGDGWLEGAGGNKIKANSALKLSLIWDLAVQIALPVGGRPGGRDIKHRADDIGIVSCITTNSYC